MASTPHLRDLIAARLSRRRFLSHGLKGTALTATAASLPVWLTACGKSAEQLGFREVPHVLDEHLHVPEGYQAQVLLRWGDAVVGAQAPFSPYSQLPEEQARQFGYNCDFIAFMPLADSANNSSASNGSEHLASGNSERGLLCVNHEYTDPHLMFAGFYDEWSATKGLNKIQVDVEMAALGHSVTEIRRQADGTWQVAVDSPLNRRITASTAMQIVGPAAGDPRLQTIGDPSGTRVAGTLGNCAGGVTPWGTVLIAEENFGGYFSGDLDRLPAGMERERANLATVNVAEPDAAIWGHYYDRFNVNRDPLEANRFGWMVELDPYDPDSLPRKLTALGRFCHEGATLVTKPGQPVVAYTGDDGKHRCVFKFVSNGVYDPDNPAANRDLLVDGQLYAAKFHEDGGGEWLLLQQGEGPLTAANGFATQADVLIDCRRAAELIGATPMDRPEDVETNPVTDRTYVVLTNNSKRSATDAANPRGPNPAGHVLELLPPGSDGDRDHTATAFAWDIFVLGGDPDADEPHARGAYGPGTSEFGWFACPDNIAFDNDGRLWVATDGSQKFGFADGVWVLPTTGEHRGRSRHFLSCPIGAEVCGPAFTPDGQSFFVSIQHPGDGRGANFANPLTRWPDFDSNMPPRPSVVAIRRDGGGTIGG